MNNGSKQSLWIGSALLVIAISFAGGFAAGEHARPDVVKITKLSNKETAKPTAVDFSPFWKAWNVIDEKYVPASGSTTDAQDKVWGAIGGLAASLKDPYTVFFPPEDNKLFESEIAGSFEGVGMEIGIKDDIITVIAPLKDSPAARAGILPGDKLLKIDDSVTAGMSREQAVKLIRGKKGTAVALTVIREGKKEPFEIKITRDTIAIPTIDTEIRPSGLIGGGDTSPSGLQKSGVFVIKLYSFSKTSPDLFRNALRSFIETGSGKLILDLRGNPGGFLDAAVDMASWFLPPGKVVVSEDFGKNAPPIYYRSYRAAVFNKNLRFVILVNGGSASASEILAGALQEYGIAKVVGTPTFGKGVVQELVDITPETSLKVTVAQWLTPNGRSIAAKGITPDVEVKMTADDLAKGRDPQMDEAIRLLTNSK